MKITNKLEESQNSGKNINSEVVKKSWVQIPTLETYSPCNLQFSAK